MKADEALLVCSGRSKPTTFRYVVERRMDSDICKWLQETFPKGYGRGYYYSHGEIWFKTLADEVIFRLVWA